MIVLFTVVCFYDVVKMTVFTVCVKKCYEVDFVETVIILLLSKLCG